MSLFVLFALVGVAALVVYQFSDVVHVLQGTSGFVDEDYQMDWQNETRRVGTAFRVSSGGLLDGKPRYYVILLDGVRDEPIVLYEGVSLYPDPPPRPRFVSASGSTLEYEVEESGKPFLMSFDVGAY